MLDELFKPTSLFSLVLSLITPYIVIWTINTLFPSAAIEYSIDTWAAAYVLIGFLKPTVHVHIDKTTVNPPKEQNV